LDEVNLGAAETALIGNVKNAIMGLGVLTVGSSDLDVVLVSNSFKLSFLLAQEGQVDVHGSTQGGTEIGWA